MRWGLRISSSKQQQRESGQQQPLEQDRQQADTNNKQGKSKAIFSSFSPVAWLAKLTTAKNAVATATTNTKAGQATPTAAKNTTAHHQAATAAFPSCFHKRPTSPSLLASSSSSSAADAEAADTTGPTAAGIAPRRRSVGNDDARTEAARQQLCHRRHYSYSVGGDRDRDLHLPPLSRLVSLSPKAPAPVRTTLAPTMLLPPLPASDGEEEKRAAAARIISRRRIRRRRVAVSSGRRSFSSSSAKAAPAGAVRVRSPRPSAAAVTELERFAVVRRTRDPQRAFRASMVEMIASKRMVGRPQELETLLACYLSLNADEHHDCIVKVFRQVWFDLNNNNNNNNTSRAAATATAVAAPAPPQRT